MGIVVEYLGNIGLEVVRDRIKDSAMETAARDRLRGYLARQSKINEVCTREEEIDFERLANYIQEELIEDVKVRLFGEPEERARSRDTILSKAISYAQSKTNLSKKRAQKIVEDSIAILQGYYRSKVNRELLFVAAQIEDTVSKKIDNIEQNLSTKMAQIEEKVGEANLLSLDKNVALVRAGELSQVESNISTVLKTISLEHSLSPDYGFAMEGQGNLISIPLTEKAIREYPPRFNVTASSVRLGDTVIKKIDDDVFSQSYRHQLPISMDVVTAKKYLGDVLDPSQKEAEKMTGAHLIMTPPSFPTAFPCSISVDDNVYFDYVLLRTKEILDDGTILITNGEQDRCNFDISLSFNPQSKEFLLNVHRKTPTNAELLRYFEFITGTKRGGVLIIKALDQNIVLAKGPLTQTDVPSLQREIKLLKKIVEIEKYFNVQFEIPDWISIEDYEVIDHLYCLIETGTFSGRWTTMDFTFAVTDQVKERVAELTDDSYMLWYAYNAILVLFGHILHMPIRRKLECATVKDLERTKQKAQILETDDALRVKCIPGDGSKESTYIDSIASEDDEFSVMHICTGE